MRLVATVLMWLVTTVMLAVTVPAMWAQHNLVDGAGYAALAQKAAADPELQASMASVLTTQVGLLGSGVDSTIVSRIAAAYTAGPAFPAQYAVANGFAHRWLFTDTVTSTVDPQGRWVIDLAPMLSDTAFAQTFRDHNISVPSAVPMPLTDKAPEVLRPGSLREVGMWAPWVSMGVAVLAAASILLTVYLARNRGRILVALGVSALITGATGWAAIEFGQRQVREMLNQTPDSLRSIADAMVASVEASMHQWLNVTLIVGGGLVIVGVIVSLLSSLAGASSG